MEMFWSFAVFLLATFCVVFTGVFYLSELHCENIHNVYDCEPILVPVKSKEGGS